uniref:Peroxisomal NADH pyrophosphatase NUDT12 n=1 Tax=Phallusia mammillata TaxID=59560 RepID=A0A6F9DM33_9ASCI|nr:peroxisomal NADH pyrophosphatase NUDT12 [Phallusia mammillata]
MTPANAYHLLKRPVEFVTASDKPSTSEYDQKQRNKNLNSISGDDVRAIYESVLCEPSSSTGRKRKQKQSKGPHKKQKKAIDTDSKANIKLSQVTPSKPVNPVSDLFRAAENGKINEVQYLVENQFVDIDVADQYKWTALMMASHNGHMDIVQFLLMHGADWKHSVDASGYDAYDLASLGGHPDIAHLLLHSKSFVKSEVLRQSVQRAHQAVKAEKLWCELCDCSYTATTHGDEDNNPHKNSVLHQFSKQQKQGHSTKSHFFFDWKNKGYRMLRSGGWDGNSGLGPDRSGHKFPVKTVLKRDRRGLGLESTESKAKITHFAPMDKTAVCRETTRKAEKVKLKTKQERERKIEIDFRKMFK